MARPTTDRLRQPTRTELRVLRLLAQGLTRKEIALHLGLGGAASVDFHLRHLRQKLGVATLGGMVYRAVSEGLLLVCHPEVFVRPSP